MFRINLQEYKYLCVVSISLVFVAGLFLVELLAQRPGQRSVPYQVSKIGGRQVVAKGPENAITFNMPASELNIGQRVWLENSQARGVTFPVTGKQRSGGTASWIETSFTLSTVKLPNLSEDAQTSQIKGESRIDGQCSLLSTINHYVVVILLGEDGKVLFSTPIQFLTAPYCSAPPTPPPDFIARPWSFGVPRAALNNVRSIKIAHITKSSSLFSIPGGSPPVPVKLEDLIEAAKKADELAKIWTEKYEVALIKTPGQDD